MTLLPSKVHKIRPRGLTDSSQYKQIEKRKSLTHHASKKITISCFILLCYLYPRC